MYPTFETYDVIVVGGGPAGLSAALMLGRCRRRTLVLDAGPKRNESVDRMWGFLSRDGTDPSGMLREAREQITAYPDVEVCIGPLFEARDVRRLGDGDTAALELDLQSGDRVRGRKLLLATGVVDDVPDIEGIGPLYGKSVHHCPYCHGWEARDRPLAVYGRGAHGMRLALEMTLWSPGRVTLCTDGPAELEARHRARLIAHDIAVREEPVSRLEGTPDGQLRAVHFASGPSLDADNLFFSTDWRQRSDLASRLGCPVNEKGSYDTGPYETTCVPGVYVAGDASPKVHFAVVAAAEGAQAAFAINTALLQEDLAGHERDADGG